MKIDSLARLTRLTRLLQWLVVYEAEDLKTKKYLRKWKLQRYDVVQ